jgi:Protein of unknown function (DUF3568)
MFRVLRLAVLVPLLLAATGCASIGITLAGLGAGVGMNHYTNNVASRTFTEPLLDVRQAVDLALTRMGIPVESTAQTEAATMITARAGNREIEIELEPITASTTRMQSIARREGSLLLDSATAGEIIAQTERILGQPRGWDAAQQN